MPSQVNEARLYSSETYAKNLYIQYRLGNKDILTAEQAGMIEATYGKRCEAWLKAIETHDTDKNNYIISDGDWNAAIKDGEQYGRDLTGYDNNFGDKALQVYKVGTDGALSVGTNAVKHLAADELGEATVKVVGKQVFEKAAEKAAEKVLKNTAEDVLIEKGKDAIIKKTTEELGRELTKREAKAALTKAGPDGIKKAGEAAVKETAKKEALGKALKCASVLAASAMDVITFAKYTAENPNYGLNDAVTEMGNDLGNQQNIVFTSNDTFNAVSENSIEVSDGALSSVDKANAIMSDFKDNKDIYAEKKYYYDKYITAGGKLTQDQVKDYKDCVAHMMEATNNTVMTKEEAEAAVNDAAAAAEDLPQTANAAAEDVAGVKGNMEYLSGMDSQLEIEAYVEAGSCTLNGTFAGINAYKAGAAAVATGWCGLGFAYAAAAVASAAAAVGDGIGATKQFGFAQNAGQVKDGRMATQSMVEEATGNYEKTAEIVTTSQETINEGAVLEVPEDMLTPVEEGDIPVAVEGEDEPAAKDPKKKDKK